MGGWAPPTRYSYLSSPYSTFTVGRVTLDHASTRRPVSRRPGGQLTARTLNYDIVQGTRRRAEVVTREVCCVRTTAYVTQCFRHVPGVYLVYSLKYILKNSVDYFVTSLCYDGVDASSASAPSSTDMPGGGRGFFFCGPWIQTPPKLR